MTEREVTREDFEYAQALQRAIEHHCKGMIVPPEIAEKCPHHAEKLNRHLIENAPEQGSEGEK